MYTLLLAMPLPSDDGVVFVLKSGSEGTNTRWLKDDKTDEVGVSGPVQHAALLFRLHPDISCAHAHARRTSSLTSRSCQ
jgi:hypothetical protein